MDQTEKAIVNAPEGSIEPMALSEFGIEEKGKLPASKETESEAKADKKESGADGGKNAVKSEGESEAETSDGEADQTKEETQKSGTQEKTGETEEGEESKAKTGDTRLLAGKYKTPEELEKAHVEQSKLYELSSNRGYKLHKLLKESEAAKAKLEDQIKTLSLKAELGDFKEKTKEELAEMSAEERIDYKENLYTHRRKQEELKAVQEKTKREQEESRKEILASQDEDLEKMNSDPKEFPMFNELRETMAEIANTFPWMDENPQPGLPGLTYLASLGILYREKLVEEAKAKVKSAEDVKGKAESQAARSGASGGSGKVSTPKVTGSSNGRISDEEWNKQIVNAGGGSIF